MNKDIFIPIESFSDERQYWLEKLSGELSELKLPIDSPRGNILETTGYHSVFPGEIAANLARISRNNDLSLFVILLTSLKILLLKYTGQDDIVVSSPTYNISDPQYNQNVLFRDIISPEDTFKEMLMKVKQTVAEGYKNQYYSVRRLVELLAPGTNVQLFRVILLYENIHDKKNTDSITNDFENDLLISIGETNGKLETAIRYNSALFKPGTIEQFLDAYYYIMSQVLENLNITIGEVEAVTAGDKHKMLYEFNNTEIDFPGDKTIHRLFEEQVSCTPNNTAVSIPVDLADIYDELESETINKLSPSLLEKLGKSCFKADSHIFECDFDYSRETGGYKILKSTQQKSIIVNKNTAAFIGLLDGTRNLKSIFTSLEDLDITFIVYSLKMQDVIELSYEFKDSPDIFTNKSIEEFIYLVKLLYRNHLILLDDFNVSEPVFQSPVQEQFDENEFIDTEIPVNTLLNQSKELTQAPLLFLGDTPGIQTVGLLHLASYLKRRGHQSYVQFYNTNWSRTLLRNNIKDLLRAVQPEIVAVSLKWFPHMARVLEICEIVKEFAKEACSHEIKVVLGGNTASYFQENIIHWECVDYVICGDGELPLLKLLENEKEELIPNLVYKRDGEINSNPISYRETPDNGHDMYLSHLDETLISRYGSLFGTFFIYTHKGCGMNCFFCGGALDANKKSFNRTKLYRRSPKEVRLDIEEAKKYTSTFMFDFDAPNMNMLEYLKDIWGGIDLSNHFCIYTNLIPPTPDIVEYTNKTFKYVFWNLDVASLSERHRDHLYSLNVVKPQPTDNEILSFFDECQKYDNAEIRVNLIAGLPCFTQEDMGHSDNLLSNILSKYTCCSELHWARLHAEPGAPLLNDTEKYHMYSYANSFEEFFEYSKMNFGGHYNVEFHNYPYIYFKDEAFNSKISKFYAETNEMVSKYKRKKKERIIIYENMSYRELNQRSNRLAHAIREKGIRDNGNHIVGLMIPGSLETAIGILGVLKAGAAYLPIDPDYPRERKAYIAKDSNIKLLAVGSALTDDVKRELAPLSVISMTDRHLDAYSRENAGIAGNSSDPVYAIYTSGTTGKPRGVIVRHKGLANYTYWRIRSYNCTAEDVTLEPLSYCFDGFGSNFFSSLLPGGILLMVADIYKRDFHHIKEIIRHRGVTNVSLVPGMYEALLDTADAGELESMRFVVLAGERAGKHLLEKGKKKIPGVLHINEYGPTEATVTAAGNLEMKAENTAIIGKPIDNVQVYILDTLLKPIPVGAVGELFIAGPGVAIGYLNMPGLTGEKFPDFPLGDGVKIYRTGDLARWLADGTIELLGRVDHQVKIRGYRIETGEIENQLQKHDNVKDTVVIARETARKSDHESTDKYLCAYIVAEEPISIPGIKDFLSRSLPDYMIPSYFIEIEQIPLTNNGKLDRNALPLPETGFEFIAPRNETERKLAAIWAEVLGRDVDQIGIDHSFFELGGHSLKATVEAAKIHKVFDVKVPLEEIFKLNTIRQLAEYIKGASREEFSSIEVAEKQDYYPLSPAQLRLYILQQMELRSTSYNTPMVVLLEGELEKEKLEDTFRVLVQRHESLRTSFQLINDHPMQRINDDAVPALEYYEMDEEEAEEWASNFRQPFELDRAPLFRVGLTAIAKDKYLLAVDMHHIITDGTSMEILVREFMAIYNGEKLAPLRIQYKDYSQWLNQEKQKDATRQKEAYWLEQFAGELPVLALPIDYPRPQVRSFEGDVIVFEIGIEETRALQKLAIDQDVTLFSLLLSIYNIVLSKVTGQQDIVVGTPVAGRRHADLEPVIGMFVNTLALRNDTGTGRTFLDFLEDVSEIAIKAFENQEYQFEDLVDKVVINGREDTSRNPLFDVMFILQNLEPGGTKEKNIDIPGLKVQQCGLTRENSKFDMTLTGVEISGSLRFSLTFCTKLFKRKTIKRFTDYYKKIVTDVLEDPERKISHLEIIPEAEKREKLRRINRSLEDKAAAGTIQNRLRQSFRQHSGHVAVEYGTTKILYRELEQRSASVSNWLIKNKIEKGSFIGIYIDDKIDIISAILGVLNAGCVFVPLDSELKAKRLEAMLGIIPPRVILTDKAHEEKIRNIGSRPGEQIQIVVIDHTFFETYDRFLPGENNIQYSGEDKVYVYFTSGSTGVPKAVLGKNSSMLQYLQWEIDTFEINSGTRASQLAGVGFDASLKGIIIPLLVGGTVCIPGEKNLIFERESLVNWIDQQEITIIHCVPSVFRVLNSPDLSPTHFNRLRYVLMAGEVVHPQELKNWYKIFDERIQLVNLYGPTETTMVKTFYFIQKNDAYGGKISIGKPMRGTDIVILDNAGNICPRGVVGEIHIRTPYMTYGYYNDPGLTDERFIPNPFNNDASDLIYKTGDFGKENTDGSFEFIGRVDGQVKVRGIRLELGEIETSLLQHDDIEKAVVLTKKNKGGEMYLAAYIVSGRDFSSDGLRECLSQDLAEYMIPSQFVQIEEIPLTLNGKIDRQSLLAIEIENTTGESVAPRNQVEEKLAKIWSEILGIEKDIIGINHNFFELGGHSLKAIALIAKIRKEFNVTLPLAKIFGLHRIEMLADYIAQAAEEKYAPIPAAPEKEYYPLSSAQGRIFVLHEIDFESTAYNMPRIVELEGIVDKNKLMDVFSELIKRHESFRTSFHMIEEEPVQKIHDTINFEIDFYDLEHDTAGDVTVIINNFISPFDLSRAPLMRLGLIKLGKTNHIMMIDIHHIISDGVSSRIMIEDFMALYSGNILPDLRIQYKDYSHWKNGESEKETTALQETYWLNQFAGEIPVLNIPTDYPRPAIQDFEGDVIPFKIPADQTNALKEFALEKGATLYMVLLAINSIMLSKISSQEDIVIGTPAAGRRHTDLERIIGVFINTMALRTNPVGEKAFPEFLEEIKINALKAFENQDYPFEDLVDKVQVKRNVNRNPLFDFMFLWQNIDMGTGEIPTLTIPGLKLKPHKRETIMSKFDMTLAGTMCRDTLHFSITYAVKLFKKETVLRFITFFKTIISAVIEAPYKKIKDIDILSEAECLRLLSQFNAPTVNWPQDKTIHEMFEEQAERCSGRCAAVSGRRHITYGELNDRANRLAQELQEKGVGPEAIVAILEERSIEMVTGILAILKAGSAYLPIAPDYPQERIDYMKTDSNARLLLTPGDIPTASQEPPAHRTPNPAANKSVPTNLAYIIYTSGTTGRPKGTMIEHRNVVRLMVNDRFQFDVSEADTWSVFHSFCFDFSIWEMYGALLYGGKMVIVSRQDARDTDRFLDILQEEKVTMLSQTPSAFNNLSELVSGKTRKPNMHIRYIVFGGEALKPSKLAKWYEMYPQTRLINMYGITETTVHVTFKEIDQRDIRENTGSIGKPIPTLTAYVMDRHNNLLPPGVPGECCVGGEGVSRGYLNRPALTSEKFIRNPFKPGEILYRSGDLVKMAGNGELHYLGRIDQQVKIRGFRIELGEIESRLLKRDEVKEAVVLARETGGEKYLCAYIATDSADTDEIRDFLSRKLPEYMVPAFFVKLDKIPLTSSGKVDVNALPEQETQFGDVYAAPRNKEEHQLTGIWSDVLKLDKEKIGIDDDFFKLGGHSLKATRMTSRIYKELNVKIPLAIVFKSPTIRDLSQYIKENGKETYVSIQPAEEREYYPLSFAQRRLWILCQFEEDSIAYNMPMAFEISDNFNPEIFGQALQALVDRHESLRTIFIKVDGEPKQKILKHVPVNLEIIDIRDLDPQEKETETRKIYLANANYVFNLENGPLFLFKLVWLEDEKYLLIYNIHHIVNDGWSQSIINNEALIFYNAIAENKQAPLRRPELQYKDYTLWHNALIAENSFNTSVGYWLEKFKDKPNGIQLPTDHPRPAIQTFNGGRVLTRIDSQRTSKLEKLSRENDATLFMSLLTLVNIFLYKYTGETDIVIGSPIAGRKQTELHELMGFLVNTLVYRMTIEPTENFVQLLAKARKETMDCYEYQDFPFDLLVERLELERDLSQSPIFNIMLAHNNADLRDESLGIEGAQSSGYSHSGDFNMSKFDLIFFINRREDHISVVIEYNSDLFEHTTAQRMLNNFTHLVDSILDNHQAPIPALGCQETAEYEKVVHQFNATDFSFPGLSIQQLIEKQVEISPHRTAVVHNLEHITYAHLNQRANQLAHFLRDEYSVKPGDIIGVFVDRSLEMIIAILGIIKSGAGYLSIDPGYPKERLEHMLADSGTKLIVTQQENPELLDGYNGRQICIHPDHQHKMSLKDIHNPASVNNLSDIVYVIYTSGSTGTPNGALLPHGILSNLVQWQQNNTGIDSSGRCLQFTSINFCVSFQEIVTTLSSGGILHLIGDIERQDIDYLINFLNRNKIGILYLPFSYLNFLFNEFSRWKDSFGCNLKHIVTAGEQLKITSGLKKFLLDNPQLKLHNHYGSSEMHVVTSFTMDASTLGDTLLPPAGQPIANTKIYILDEHDNVVPMGVWGELCIAGSCEISGYINNKQLTDKKLFAHPELCRDGKRLYRSGDIGRWKEDGNIELKGRKDTQIKIRGFRVEPGEIESKITLLDNVKDCVVVVKEGSGEKYLAAYVVGRDIEAAEIKRFIGSYLPQYMVPMVITLEAIPLMPNGKVDRDKLPEPELKTEGEYVAPGNQLEEQLVELYSDVLELQPRDISIDASFFDLGGHSLKATVLSSRIHSVLNVEIPLAEIFKNPSIKEIASLISVWEWANDPEPDSNEDLNKEEVIL